jgi:hypothetical protein
MSAKALQALDVRLDSTALRHRRGEFRGMRRIVGVVTVAGSMFAADGMGSGGVDSNEVPTDTVTDKKRSPAARPKTAGPIFVVGFQRSGTTLLRAMLDEHPEIALTNDGQFIPRFWHIRDRYVVEGRVDARRLVADVMLTPRVAEWELPEDLVAARIEELGDDPTFSDAIAVVFRVWADMKGKAVWGDKTPGNVLRIELLGSLFPQARFLHVIRDGRDATVSCLRNGVVVDTVARGADLWSHRVGRGRRAGRALGPARYMEVRYDDLVADPAATLTGVCGFLGLEFDDAMLGYAGRALSDLPERVRWRHPNLAKPPTKVLRDWRSDLTPSDLAVFQAIGGRLLTELGYERGVDRIPLPARLAAWRQVASARSGALLRTLSAKVRGKGPFELDRA